MEGPGMNLHLSRLELRRDSSLVALASILAPDDDGSRADRGHRLLWAVFSDAPDRKRDFLWREENLGRYVVLSTRRPVDAHNLFDIDTKDFQPALAKGDGLRFVLRANAVVTRKNAAGKAKRSDVVMDKLRACPSGDRALHRDRLAAEAGSEWLARQGAKAGFAVVACEAAAYRTLTIPHGRGKAVELGVLDLEGRIEVGDAAMFLSALARGFGKAKGFGCGLMLIARAR
jgi:CRISPR system Cascade subunit CasE